MKECKDGEHNFNVTSMLCSYKHCSKCGVCQAIGDCNNLILFQNKIEELKILKGESRQ